MAFDLNGAATLNLGALAGYILLQCGMYLGAIVICYALIATIARRSPAAFARRGVTITRTVARWPAFVLTGRFSNLVQPDALTLFGRFRGLIGFCCFFAAVIELLGVL